MPLRVGVRKIAKRFGVDPGTAQRISRPFDCAGTATSIEVALANAPVSPPSP